MPYESIFRFLDHQTLYIENVALVYIVITEMYSHLSVYIANSTLYKSCLSYCSYVHKAVIFGSIVLQKYALRKSVSRQSRFRKDHNSYCPLSKDSVKLI